ncbi:MAG TPA: sulfurtransferase [Gaiellaceae bacterium]|nr:sulfurtransferase [Gaiellaceae bacterium]
MTGNGRAERVLVSTGWLDGRLGAAGLVVAEVDENTDLYAEGHIPGSVELHWRRDLQHPIERDVADRTALERLLGGLGIGEGTTVVVYGDRNNWFAAYAYWYLRLYGHADVRILDGGRQKWIDEGRTLTSDRPTPQLRDYRAAQRDESIRAYRDRVLEGLGAPGRVLIDVRSTAEYAGELVAPPGYECEGAQRGGHIPTAISIPWASAVANDGTFKSAEALRALYVGSGVTPDLDVTCYCRIGERSAHTWFVLHELLGYERVRNYDGSWTEWGNLIGAPIERGVSA